MRWMPLYAIFILSFLSGVYILTNIREFYRRREALISVAYLTFLGMILFSPISFDGRSVYFMQTGVGRVNLYRIYYDLGFAENVVLTVPLGFLIKKNFSQISLINIIPIGLMIGATIETAQYYLSHMFLINRSSDISDVISNGIGVLVGAVLVLAFEYAHERRIVIESK
ncbi:VanZ family protein [Companilactobacillus kedongensis]|uniref:VanZ family protein n=1 Tax=Companilactobacillus kedongensis TaxID=2486004 RepID=UPI000F77A698|nr:VanZ family protein [Companilactobacillus kedongensis]